MNVITKRELKEEIAELSNEIEHIDSARYELEAADLDYLAASLESESGIIEMQHKIDLLREALLNIDTINSVYYPTSKPRCY